MAERFHSRNYYVPTGYRLLPFRFGRLDNDRYVLSNDVGEHVVLPRHELVEFAEHRLSTESDAYRELKSKHMLFDDNSECALDLLALKYRSRAETIANFTGLHIFVVTLRCDHTCHYCQVSRQTEDKAAFDLTRASADLGLLFTFKTPARAIKIEFQGGEPLLNFGMIRYVVEEATTLARERGKKVSFVIASNLSRLTDEILAFCKDHGVYFSTSLDGPESLHNTHRTVRDGSSHSQTVAGIRRVREVLGSDYVSAVMTTTHKSLALVEQIV
jgi:uncharacterized protein